MPTLIEQYQSEDVSRDLKQRAQRIDQIADQRAKQLAALANLQSDEKANVDGFLNDLSDVTGSDQVKSENRAKLRSFAKKQWRLKEIQQLSLYVSRGATNQNDTAAELLDRLLDQIATDAGSDFATLMAAITAANTARNA